MPLLETFANVPSLEFCCCRLRLFLNCTDIMKSSFECHFEFCKKEKSHGGRSGDYWVCRATVLSLLGRNSCTGTVLWVRALSPLCHFSCHFHCTYSCWLHRTSACIYWSTFYPCPLSSVPFAGRHMNQKFSILDWCQFTFEPTYLYTFLPPYYGPKI
jgi:hypothetical protein